MKWAAADLAASPWLRSLQPVLAQLGWQRFPSEADWANRPATLQPQSRSGQIIRFARVELADTEGYEQRIARTGVVATRPDNWHDAFNALCWLAWPQSKAALNALHLRELAGQAGSLRSRARDAATLFDESGLVLALSEPGLQTALLAHDWNTLFQQQRDSWGRTIAAFSFGHALMEKSLAPFIGIVAKVVLMPVTADWFDQPLVQQLMQLDRLLAARIDASELVDPRQLPPLPVLGIPGWWPQQDAAFYADQRHFRPKRPVVHPR